MRASILREASDGEDDPERDAAGDRAGGFFLGVAFLPAGAGGGAGRLAGFEPAAARGLGMGLVFAFAFSFGAVGLLMMASLFEPWASFFS